ncbi:MAG: DUF3579 domain-containing protein [Gammaproteobacteria bacterium]|nr:DUF3579 domain-containing protein [Gammaproteobacteria bacterium]MDH5777350.1 DUF3579 domain-containing protein [Gammaproteobacteria bacterium]
MQDEKIVIYGVTESGQKLRPSDWIERISSSLAGFCSQKKLKYCNSVQPCIIEGEKCLVVSRNLENIDPASYEFVLGFARSNHLKIVVDRRQGDRALDAQCEAPPA